MGESENTRIGFGPPNLIIFLRWKDTLKLENSTAEFN